MGLGDDKPRMLCDRYKEGEATIFPCDVTQCVQCGHDVNISKTSHKRAKEVSAEITCLQCYAKWINETNPAPEDIDIRALSSKDEVDEFMNWIHKNYMSN